ncbi:diaminopimelate epimerase [Allochromatium humboldtianum]|uniref:Diaminopimelate epimerase n=1 Tax=Allochromatium humboldtianum TaxID=504901 RepID=A0A850RGL9_9GAMM|nr:diaminopimelate epimerase [Allochromatium humboldtianum]NVZ10302.1 diaminopimelate epimerase [Allochromatium humboldtianum]
MRLRFTKMQGLGNDFVVFDAVRQRVDLDAGFARRLADRRFGVGCDQILLVEPPRLPETDFHYRIFNADGSEVEQCGNGARCFARFVRDQGLTDKDEIPVGTAAGAIRLYLEPDGQVRVDMGAPEFTPARIPFTAETETPDATYPLEVEGRTLTIGALSMGNPHAVLIVDDVDSAQVATLGPLIEHHPDFPRRVNVGFMQILGPNAIRLRVHERGSGETLACGTGACAAVVSGRRRGRLDERVRVALPGGELVIEWRGPGHPVWMTGPAVNVFEGEIER